jgi:polyisoprenoid-binding protein YceI
LSSIEATLRAMTKSYTIEFNVYGTGPARHVFCGPATRVETAESKADAVKQALAFAAERYPDRTFEVVAVETA